jgi:K+-sensing histidine kinase KdpD
VLAVRPSADGLSRPEDRRLLDAFANQAALALQRSLSERRSAGAALDAETERLRNTLLSGISHDFRTPLTTILGRQAACSSKAMRWMRPSASACCTTFATKRSACMQR